MVALARSIYEGQLNWGPELAEVIFNCTMCRACAEQCRNIYYLTNEYFSVPYLVEKMREELVEQGKIPPGVRDYLKSVDLHGNPYQISGSKRGRWADEAGIPLYSGQEFLFYVGDEGSFDERGVTIAQSVGALLKSHVSVGILGNEEICDGNEVKSLGETGLFEVLVERNIEKFKKLGVRKIVTLSPHAYNSMKNEYPKRGGDFQVMHYTQLLEKLMDQRKLDFSGFSDQTLGYEIVLPDGTLLRTGTATFGTGYWSPLIIDFPDVRGLFLRSPGGRPPLSIITKTALRIWHP